MDYKQFFANTPEEFFGTLLQSVTEGHKAHLKTSKYSDHMALDEFYDEMTELVDALIEHYQGINGKIEDINKRLERTRLLVRSIECAFNRNASEETKDMIQMKENRTKGYYFGSVDSENGIFIH